MDSGEGRCPSLLCSGGVWGRQGTSWEGDGPIMLHPCSLLLCVQMASWGWLIKYLILYGEDSKEGEMWFLPWRSLPILGDELSKIGVPGHPVRHGPSERGNVEKT